VRPLEGEVLHFSEDPAITEFVPHVAATARVRPAYVWAVDANRAPDYWFPRDCPRVLAWATSTSSPTDTTTIIGPGGGQRVHAVEYRWLERIRTVRLYAYRLPATVFEPILEPQPIEPIGTPQPHAHVATVTVHPLGPPEPVGDLLALHEEAGIQLRVLPELSKFWAAVTASSLGWSGIRLRNTATWDPTIPR
jgi:hypothetical protein